MRCRARRFTSRRGSPANGGTRGDHRSIRNRLTEFRAVLGASLGSTVPRCDGRSGGPRALRAASGLKQARCTGRGNASVVFRNVLGHVM